MANYGISYQGSKNAIAEYIVRQLPNANTFVDLFCGGCSITHCAMLSGKYNNFIINDINKDMPQFFADCIKGKYNTKTCTEWISKEEFQKRKDSDIYIRTCWSFGNDGRTYMYGESIEPYKKALHYAIFFNDYSLLNNYLQLPDLTYIKDIGERVKAVKDFAIKQNQYNFERCIEVERLNRLSVLQELNTFDALNKLSVFTGDYRDVVIPQDSVIYCDIPYKDTKSGYVKGFNHEQFYEWARKQDNIFISEYTMPDDFIELDFKDKMVLSARGDNKFKAIERLYTNKRTYDKMSDSKKQCIENNHAIQMSFDDLM